MNQSVILSLENLSLKYGDVTALNNLSFDLRQGEILAVVGEHRSGKSSIAKILGGVVRKQSGCITLKGHRIEYLSPVSSIKNKLGIIYQETSLIPSLNSVEYIYSGRFLLGFLNIINNKKMTNQVGQFLDEWGFSLDLRMPVGRLPKADQHILELVRAVFFDPDILIFDEISNKLNAEEIEIVYQIILDLKNKGKSIIYISNNMNEIFEFADRVSILKNGSVISTQDICNLDKVRLIDLTYSFASTREELRKRNQELYNFKKYNEDIINNLPVGVIILDKDKKVYLINYSALSILSIEYIPGEADLDKLIYGFSNELKDELLLKIENLENMSWEEIEYEDNKYLNITLFPFKDEDYVFLGTIILIQDISRDYHFKNYLFQAERISSVAELAAGVAHEVNNPLNIVLNYVELLKLHNTDEYSNEKIFHIKDELNRIKSIIGSLLSFAHLNETPMQHLDLVKLIDDTLLLMNHQFKEKRISLDWISPDDIVPVVGNKNRLKQVIINILINGIEAVDNDGKLIIVVQSDKSEGYAEIEFINNGPKIPDNIATNIFTPFYSTKEDEKNTGLGLSICQHIIEAHQGIITCRSSKNETCFSIHLPLCS